MNDTAPRLFSLEDGQEPLQGHGFLVREDEMRPGWWRVWRVHGDGRMVMLPGRFRLKHVADRYAQKCLLGFERSRARRPYSPVRQT